MTHQNYHAKVENLKNLIGQKRANTTQEIARRLKVSQRTVLLMIDFVEKSGTVVKYCREARVYSIGGCRNQIA